MRRYVYRTQCRAGAEEELSSFFTSRIKELKGFIKNEEVMTLSIYKWVQNFFVYYECTDRPITPKELFGDTHGLLLKWPGEDALRDWVPMLDIYHCCEPVDKEFWQRKQAIKRAYATVNRLRPEMLSSYIFYHYQYQEEKPGDWAKYASIHLNENLMFFYQEESDGPVTPPYEGRLNTSNTPGQWQELMNHHFLPWEDDPDFKKPWREIEQVLFL